MELVAGCVGTMGALHLTERRKYVAYWFRKRSSALASLKFKCLEELVFQNTTYSQRFVVNWPTALDLPIPNNSGLSLNSPCLVATPVPAARIAIDSRLIPASPRKDCGPSTIDSPDDAKTLRAFHSLRARLRLTPNCFCVWCIFFVCVTNRARGVDPPVV